MITKKNVLFLNPWQPLLAKQILSLQSYSLLIQPLPLPLTSPSQEKKKKKRGVKHIKNKNETLTLSQRPIFEFISTDLL